MTDTEKRAPHSLSLSIYIYIFICTCLRETRLVHSAGQNRLAHIACAFGLPIGRIIAYKLCRKTDGRAALPYSMEGQPFRDSSSPSMCGLCMASARVAGLAPASVEAASD